MAEEIKITITPKGFKVDTSGFEGNSCLKPLEGLKKHMRTIGVNSHETHQEKKPELYLSGQTDTNTISTKF